MGATQRHEAITAQAVSPLTRGAIVRIIPAPDDCVIPYEAEIDVALADRIAPTCRLFSLRLQGVESIWITDTELRALMVAAGALLNIAVEPLGAAA